MTNLRRYKILLRFSEYELSLTPKISNTSDQHFYELGR